MIAFVLVAALAAQADVQVVDVAERHDAAIVVLAPFGRSTHTRASDLVAAAASAFEAKTELRMIPAAQAGVDVDAMLACPADRRLSCWVDLTRAARIEALLIVTIASSSQEDQAAMTMIDLAETRGMTEEQIFEHIADVPAQSVEDPVAMFAAAVSGALAPFLEKHRYAGTLGTAAIDVDCQGCELVVRSRSIAISAPKLEMRGLPEGEQELAISRLGEVVCRVRVTIRRGEEARGLCSPIDPESDAQKVLLYGGLASGALGATAILSSLAIAAGGPSQVCFGRDESKCDRVIAARSGFGGEGITTIAESNNGFPLMPVGAGVLAAGVVWTAGANVLDARRWWVALLSGIAIGAATTAIAFVAE